MPGGRPNPTAEPHVEITVSIDRNKVVCNPDPAHVKSGGTLQLVGEKHTGQFPPNNSPFLDFESPSTEVNQWTTKEDPQGSGRFVSPKFRIITLTPPPPKQERRFAYELEVKDKNGTPIPVDPVVIVDL
jgi:hypothetical protein